MWTMPLLLSALGCKKVEDVPADLDGAMHFLWTHLEEGTDEELVSGVISLDGALGGATLEETTDGSISRLTAPEVEPLGVTDRDPALAAGIVMGNLITCNVEMVAEILTWPEQDVLYPGVYQSYARTYHGDIGTFLDGGADTLEWSLDYGAKVISSDYTGHTEALMRRVGTEAFGEEETSITKAYVVRYFAPDPAVFEEGSSRTFEQDYQFEVYWNRGSGETLHAYSMWRQANWGVGFTSEDESVQRLLLNGMADWDKDTDDICAEGGPAAAASR